MPVCHAILCETFIGEVTVRQCQTKALLCSRDSKPGFPGSLVTAAVVST